uniref:FXYD domain-containing ion transport regulator n=1 Tax=Sus scrofa TaxID=9823 RepID=A0A8D0VXZ1_PIG
PQDSCILALVPESMFFFFFFSFLADKNSPFYYGEMHVIKGMGAWMRRARADWHSLRVGGLICAGTLCALGIIILLSEQRGRRVGTQGKGLSLSPSPGSAQRPELQDGMLPPLPTTRAPSHLSMEGSLYSIFILK